jgi:hypothetical protein
MSVMNVVTSLIGLSTAVAIIYLVRKDHLHVRYGLVWSIVAVVFALLGFFPGIFDRIGQAAGIAYPPMLAITIGFVALVLKILISDIERSRNQVRVQRLVQRTALLEAEMRELQRMLERHDKRGSGDEPPVA